MQSCRIIAVSLLLSCPIIGTAKDKKKIVLPTDVLDAKTVLVVVDPGAGIALDAPNANREALENVENALTNWGRFRLVRSEYNADLVILVRKGNGKIAEPTIGGVPIDNRPVIVEPTTDAGRDAASQPGPASADGSGTVRGYVSGLPRQARECDGFPCCLEVYGEGRSAVAWGTGSGCISKANRGGGKAESRRREAMTS